jgi:hypothetical protein
MTTRVAIAAALLMGGVSLGAWRLSAMRDDTPRTPVLLELFTSEGCSSCPPADALLVRLLRDQPVPGVRVVALGFHVDYWDGLGWKDRFSSKAFTARQNDYARAWRSDRIYTPQAVVNGRTEFIASSWPAAERLLTDAARRPLIPLEVTVGAPDADGRITVGAVAPGAAEGDLYLALAEDDLTSDVRAGENARRTLAHAAVVRQLTRVGPVRASARQSSALTLDPAWRREALRVVAFVQRPGTREIVALGTAAIETAGSR